ncbi:MAG: anthranilate synthase component I family protein, partial [Bacteroidota bacterium]
MATTKIRLTTHYIQRLADTITPVSVYLKIRDKYANSILLESSDYHGNENSFSYICFQPIATFEVHDQQIRQQLPAQQVQTQPIEASQQVIEALHQFTQQFEVEGSSLPFITNGIFGYTAYDAVQYFEEITIQASEDTAREIPLMYYQVFKYIIAINHFKDELYLIEHLLEGEESQLSQIENLIFNKNF